MKGMDVPIAVGSFASCVRIRTARKNIHVANMPVRIIVGMDIMLTLLKEQRRFRRQVLERLS